MTDPEARSAFPAGHFYSPVVDPAEVERDRNAIWPAEPTIKGIDFDDQGHRRLLAEVFPELLADYDYPDHAPPAEHATDRSSLPPFYSGNPAFGWLDSRALFVLVRHWRPKRWIEVGGGYSTLLTQDVNARFLDGSLDVTSIDPFPPGFLLGRTRPGRLLQQRVQDVPLAEFDRLDAGDILFIDSSHVSKTGSDVNFLVFEVLPNLAAGVRIHFHDVFLPHEYPAKWVLEENRSWNEQYLVRALLMYSERFRVVFSSSYAVHRFPTLVAQALPEGRAFGGGSLWIERVR